jgi:hypothetical protein
MPDATPTVKLGAFIAANREEILRRCREVVAKRVDPAPTDIEVEQGIPIFLARLANELAAELGAEPSQIRELRADATQHGQDLFFHGFTVAQVVHDYGDVCQAVTSLAVDLEAPISPDDFRTLNRCLDDAIAGAVSEYSRQQRIEADDRTVNNAIVLQNMLFTAITSFEALRAGNLGIGGATGDLLARTLTALQHRLASSTQ